MKNIVLLKCYYDVEVTFHDGTVYVFSTDSLDEVEDNIKYGLKSYGMPIHIHVSCEYSR